MIFFKSKYVFKTILGFLAFFIVSYIIVFLLVRQDVIAEKYLLIVDLNAESNLPTFYSTLLLLFASVILLVIATKEKQKFHWYFLGLLFLFLSLDENIGIHEHFDTLTRSVLDTAPRGIFYFSWIIPYGIALAILLAFLYKFIWNLPNKTKFLFLMSGIIFVSGAIGLEMISGIYAENSGFQTRAFRLLTFFEEILEITGVSLFIFALLDYIENNFGVLTISIQRPVEPVETKKTEAAVGQESY